MNDGIYERFAADLSRKNRQKRSAQSYLRAMRPLQNFTCTTVEDISEEDVREYRLYCKEELGWGAATLRISYSGIELFYSPTRSRNESLCCWPSDFPFPFTYPYTILPSRTSFPRAREREPLCPPRTTLRRPRRCERARLLSANQVREGE